MCEGSLRVERRRSSLSPSKTVAIKSHDGFELKGTWLHSTTDLQSCVIVLHGVASSRQDGIGFAPMFLEQGYSVPAPDSRGHGESGGSLVTYGVLERHDVHRWAAWMRAQGCKRVFGLGESMGGAILIQAAAEDGVFDAIVAECSFSDLPTIARERVVQFSAAPPVMTKPLGAVLVSGAVLYARVRYGLDLADASPQRYAARLSTPLLLIHGTDDRNIVPEHSHRIAAGHKNIVLWQPGGAVHTGASSAYPGEFRERAIAWFR